MNATEQKILLAFEYGAVIATVAQEQGVALTKEIQLRAEVMIRTEFKAKTPERLAVEMIPNILSVFETNSGPVDTTSNNEENSMGAKSAPKASAPKTNVKGMQGMKTAAKPMPAKKGSKAC